MRKLIFILLTLNTFTVSIFAQNALERASKILDMEVNLPLIYAASQNTETIYVTPITESSPIPSINQSYRHEPSHGETAFKVLYGMVTSILRHKNSECIIFIFAGDVYAGSKDLMSKRSDLFSFESITYNRIKNDFQYGIKNRSANKDEIEALNQMLTHFPKRKAKKMFNADWMVGYPFNLAGEVYENKYNICKAIVAKKGERDIFLYFMLTEASSKDFGKYLNELSGAFKFN